MLQNKPNKISQIKQSSKLLGIEWRLNTGKNFQKHFFENHSDEMRSIHEWSNKVKMTFKNSRSQTLHGLTMINHIDYDSWPYKDDPGAPFRYGSGTRVEKTLFPEASAAGHCWRQDTALKEHLPFPMSVLSYDTSF